MNGWSVVDTFYSCRIRLASRATYAGWSWPTSWCIQVDVARGLTREGLAGVTVTWPESAIIVMFTRNLGTYYRGLLGHTRVPADINRWSKRLTWNSQLEKLSVESEHLVEKYPRLATVDHVFRLEIGGSPPLEFQVNSLGFTASSNTSAPRLVVRYKGSRFGGGSSSGRMVLRALQDFLVGRLRVSGSWRALGQALSVSGAYRDVLRVLRN